MYMCGRCHHLFPHGNNRSVKKAVLRLVEVFVEKCEDDALLVGKFVPALMEPVLGDYAASVPDARWVWARVCRRLCVWLVGRTCWLESGRMQVSLESHALESVRRLSYVALPCCA